MKPTDYLDQRHVSPTLINLRRVALQMGRDRLSFVRQASADKPAGVAVLLLTKKAVRDLGPLIDNHVRNRLPGIAGRVAAFQETERVQPDEPLTRLFTLMDAHKLEWCWLNFDPMPDGSKVLVCCLIGPLLVDDFFAQKLTELGCITNLT